MRRILFIACLLLSVLAVRAEESQPLRYVDALQFRMINKGWGADVTYTPYTRIPSYLHDSITQELWDRSMNSAGLAIRFCTDSKRIGVRYNLHHNFHMAHMADTGIKGTDLYILSDDGRWQYVNTNRPVKDSIQQKIYVENMDGRMHECMIYLPLYDGINWLEIGVDSASTIDMPRVENPKVGKKIVGYGTSIMHGGCASRTGMAATNIMQRELGVEFVNLGVSGEGKLVYAMARAMAQIPEAVCYVIDPVPNCTQMQCDTLTYTFIKILRDARPEVPIIMVEGPMYPYAKWDSFFKNYLPKKNEAYRRNYELLKKENPKNLYYVTCDGLTGPDEEGTVDGIHLTDLGFRAYADILEPVLKKVLKLKK
ncbi:MAG: SGNH/GDSL hydrolase family protein [Paludibacteraceae bacterium]|nr:SGNH/GDSL hydrolase family protein [Paludibacteraceae bacterium]